MLVKVSSCSGCPVSQVLLEFIREHLQEDFRTLIEGVDESLHCQLLHFDKRLVALVCLLPQTDKEAWRWSDTSPDAQKVVNRISSCKKVC